MKRKLLFCISALTFLICICLFVVYYETNPLTSSVTAPAQNSYKVVVDSINNGNVTESGIKADVINNASPPNQDIKVSNYVSTTLLSAKNIEPSMSATFTRFETAQDCIEFLNEFQDIASPLDISTETVNSTYETGKGYLIYSPTFINGYLAYLDDIYVYNDTAYFIVKQSTISIDEYSDTSANATGSSVILLLKDDTELDDLNKFVLLTQ